MQRKTLISSTSVVVVVCTYLKNLQLFVVFHGYDFGKIDLSMGALDELSESKPMGTYEYLPDFDIDAAQIDAQVREAFGILTSACL